jgi:hypothetical protein
MNCPRLIDFVLEPPAGVDVLFALVSSAGRSVDREKFESVSSERAYSANLGRTLSTNRNNRVLWAPATTPTALSGAPICGSLRWFGRPGPWARQKRPQLRSIGRLSAQRPWSPLNEVARLLQTGRTIEDPMTASYELRWFEADPTADGNTQIAVIRPQLDARNIGRRSMLTEGSRPRIKS